MILTVTANPTIDRVYFVKDFVMGEVHRPTKMACSAGGKGINVARVSKTLGADVVAMGFVGGSSGNFIEIEVEKLGIGNEFTKIHGETRTCVNISDELGKSGEILESGPTISENEEQEFIKKFSDNIDKSNIITVSGSLPKGLDSSFYCKLIELAKKHSKKIIMDTSGKIFEDVVKAKPFMVKPNKFELSVYLGKNIENDCDVKDALAVLRDKGIEIPIISLGEDGAMAYIGETVYKFLIPKVRVINTVGSGDSTIAGIATGLDMNMLPINAIRLGMAAGIANTQFEQTGMVCTELVEKYYKEIIIKEC